MYNYEYYLVDGTKITQNGVDKKLEELLEILAESKLITMNNPDTIIFVDKIVYVMEVI